MAMCGGTSSEISEVPAQPENVCFRRTDRAVRWSSVAEMRRVVALLVTEDGIIAGPGLRQTLMGLQLTISENRFLDINTDPTVRETCRRLLRDEFFDDTGAPKKRCPPGLAIGDPRPLHLSIISRAMTGGKVDVRRTGENRDRRLTVDAYFTFKLLDVLFSEIFENRNRDYYGKSVNGHRYAGCGLEIADVLENREEVHLVGFGPPARNVSAATAGGPSEIARMMELRDEWGKVGSQYRCGVAQFPALHEPGTLRICREIERQMARAGFQNDWSLSSHPSRTFGRLHEPFHFGTAAAATLPNSEIRMMNHLGVLKRYGEVMMRIREK